jgi:hypothetical protein
MSAVLKPRRERRCRVCSEMFRPFNTIQPVCATPKCALEWARRLKAKKLRKEVRAGLVKLRTVSDWTKLAQAEFNRFVRLRDEGLPCISCGASSPPNLHGGAWDCGHYRSVGAAPELRFDERNAARQCKSCNSGTRRGGRYVMPAERATTIRAMYRTMLIQRIGLATVEWLEGPHEPKRYRVDDLIAIRDLYRTKWRQLLELRK